MTTIEQLTYAGPVSEHAGGEAGRFYTNEGPIIASRRVQEAWAVGQITEAVEAGIVTQERVNDVLEVIASFGQGGNE